MSISEVEKQRMSRRGLSRHVLEKKSNLGGKRGYFINSGGGRSHFSEEKQTKIKKKSLRSYSGPC